MTPTDRAALAERFRQEARRDRVAKIRRELFRLGGLPAEQLTDIDNDASWFRIWTAALGVGARCPSDKTRLAVREAVRSRLPPLAEVFREVGMEVWKP